jgi:hypothetical protein
MNDDEKRINIEDLAKAAEELTDEEAKNVQGGGSDAFYGTGVYKSTDGGQTWAGNTIGGSRGTLSGNTVGGSLSGDPSNPTKP